MKIFLLKQGVQDEQTLAKGLTLATQWCATIGLPLEFFHTNTTKQFTSVPVTSSVVKDGRIVNSQEIFDEAKAQGFKFDIDSVICFIYDWTKISPQPTNPAENGVNIQIPTQWYATYPEVLADFLLHELCHYCFSRDGIIDITEQYDSRFSQLPRKDWYLFLLKQFKQPTYQQVSQYKYFSQKEIDTWGLKHELWAKLDKAREYAQTPFKLTSGLRSAVKNALVGGSLTSTHLNGTGCDISCTDSLQRYKILNGLLKAGFTRIGLYPKHLHADLKPETLIWFNEKD